MSVIERLTPDQRAEIDEARRRCRMLGHRWEDYFPNDFNMTPAFYSAADIIHLRCETCSTSRHDACNTYGEVVTRRYEYPDGYKYEEDEERPSSDDLRLWMIKRNRALFGGGKKRG